MSGCTYERSDGYDTDGACGYNTTIDCDECKYGGGRKDPEARCNQEEDTEWMCVNCGFFYDYAYTKQFGKERGKRICLDCIEGLGAEDLPVGFPSSLIR